MPNPYIKDTLKLYDFLERERESFFNGRLWTLDPSSIRFRHGESVAELKVPYHLGADDEKVIGQAVQAVALLIKKRCEGASKAEQQSSGGGFMAMDGIGMGGGGVAQAGQLQAGVEFSRPLQDESLKATMLTANSTELRAAQEILSSAPLVDGEILALWLAPDGYGRKLIEWIKEVMEKAIRDESGVEIGELTSYLALLAIINTIKKHKEKLRDFKIKGVSFDKLDAAAGLTLFCAVKSAVFSLFEKLKDTNAHYYNPVYEAVLKTALTPRLFVSIPANVFVSSLNPYGIWGDANKVMLDIVARSVKGSATADEAVGRISAAFKEDSSLGQELKLSAEGNFLRGSIMEYLAEFDMANEPKHKLLRDACRDDRTTKQYLSEPDSVEKLIAAITEIKEKYWKDAKRGAAIDKLLEHLAYFSKGGVFGWLKTQKKTELDYYTEAAEAYLAFWMDAHAESFVDPMRLHMEDRRAAKYDDKMLMSEYTSGRLYRFSKDTRPILSVLKVDYEGQLFIDMKDFTIKTSTVKEIAMVEFMRENFYMPILDAASKYKRAIAAEDGSDAAVRINSLPGDAASMSSSVEHLVALSHDIQRIVWLYKEKLEKKLPSTKDGILMDIHKRHGMKKQGFAMRRDEFNKAISGGDKSAEEKLARLELEELEMDDAYRKEIEGAFSSEMEAGLFISYGVKAEGMIIPGKRGFCDTLRVAISGKINEAARGTVRNAAVRAKVEMHLERERNNRRNPNLKSPFDVHADTIYSLRMPSKFDEAVEAARIKQDDALCRELATNAARELYADLRTLASGGSSFKMLNANTDLYNKGYAMSKDALTAYINETKGKKYFFQKMCHTTSVSPKILEKFFLPPQMLEFWFSYDLKSGGLDAVEVYRRAGEVVFKGFESSKPTVIFEIMNRDGEFVKMLLSEHFKQWLEESRSKKKDNI